MYPKREKSSHPHRIEDAVEVIALVLHDARVKAFGDALDALSLEVVSAVTQLPHPRHDAAQAGDGQAPLPALFRLGRQWFEHRIDEDRAGHRVGVRITRVAHRRIRIAEDDETQRHADLGRGEPRATGRLHRLEHVADERTQLGRAEIANGLRHPQKARIAHAQDLANHAQAPPTNAIRMRTARVTATLITRSSSSRRMASLLVPKPAAWLTTTPSVA